MRGVYGVYIRHLCTLVRIWSLVRVRTDAVLCIGGTVTTLKCMGGGPKPGAAEV